MEAEIDGDDGKRERERRERGQSRREAAQWRWRSSYESTAQQPDVKTKRVPSPFLHVLQGMVTWGSNKSLEEVAIAEFK